MNWNCILERVAQTTSTNDDLLLRWRAGELIDPVARMANLQTAGKGRAGRKWQTLLGDSLCFSLAYPFKRTPAELSGLSLAVGIAVINGISTGLNISLRQLYENGLRLKWPNDILLGDKKLGGILLEGGQTQADQPTWMVIGIGLNATNAISLERAVGAEIAVLETLVNQPNQLPALDVIWLKILDQLGLVLTEFEENGFSTLQKIWLEWDAYANQAVVITGPGTSPQTGTALGVNPSGALILEQGTNQVLIHAGDVSLRGQA
ncbi:BirA Biotin-(acetyl-CoA carboxylase) ligase [Burkholderiaceae bacterium]|jgi:BirA family biotin operon repressor/biotin-[acetyl-CoA-carboxylase] ligase